QGLEDGHHVAHPDQVAGGAQAGRAAAYDRDFLAGRGSDLGHPDLAALALVIGDEPLEVADSHGLEFVAQDATSLALGLLGANAPRDRRQDVVFADLGRRLEVISGHDQVDKIPDLDADGAAFHALRRGALKAAERLSRRAYSGESLVDFFEVGPPQRRVLLAHVLTRNLDPLFVG